MIELKKGNLHIPDIFNCSVITGDFTGGQPEDTNGGHYYCREQFKSPVVGTYMTREVWSYHGDIEPIPEWECVTLAEYHRMLQKAVLAYSKI